MLDPRDDDLRQEVLVMLDRIKSEIIPNCSELVKIFARLGLRNASSCKEEIENLEDEVQSQSHEKSKTELIVALIGLVRYAKCILFKALTLELDSLHWEHQRKKKSLQHFAGIRWGIAGITIEGYFGKKKIKSGHVRRHKLTKYSTSRMIGTEIRLTL
jgi:hypothetical protein